MEETVIEVDASRRELKDFLYKHWPDTIEIINGLKLVKELNAKVFTDNNWPDVKTVIYIYKEGEVPFIYPFGTDNLKTAALVKSVIESHLDNAQQPMIMGCEEVFQEMNKLGMNQKFSEPGIRYVYTQDSTKINRPALPEGYKIDSIHSSDIEYVATRSGPAKHSLKMKEIIMHFIANYPNAAIYCTSTEPPRPVSYIVSSGLGSFFHLFTDEEHRGKGLATIVKAELMENILSKGITPVGYIGADNIKNQRISELLGYTKTESLMVNSEL